MREIDREVLAILTAEAEAGQRASTNRELGLQLGVSKDISRRAVIRLRIAGFISTELVNRARREVTILSTNERTACYDLAQEWPAGIDFSPHNIEPGDILGRVSRPATSILA